MTTSEVEIQDDDGKKWWWRIKYEEIMTNNDGENVDAVQQELWQYMYSKTEMETEEVQDDEYSGSIDT